ncbi:MAG: carboxypeptidase regulatory-like domain-containing protein [Candidatus Heimdallarchaeota archaeon]|nr:MAG: carboxypeptidase regulatory-like domain-containing protein [Candidatus Heimdallarchaeota archaeon]
MILSRRTRTKKPSRHKHRTVYLIVVLFISFTIVSEVILNNQDEIKDFSSDMVSITPLKDKSKDVSSRLPIHPPSLDIHSSKNPHILFILADPSSLDPSYDKPFIDFIKKTLGFNVTLHDDNNSYAYTGYDAIVISDSIAVDQVRSLANESIPILIMESFTFSDFRLASGRGSGWGNDIYIINSSHYITQNETIDTSVSVYSAENNIEFMKGYGSEPLWSEIDDLSQRVGHKDNERTIIALDKGKKDWDNMSAAQRRTYWGATKGNLLNQKGWELWNRTLRWVLYDDINGSATISVNVKDLDNRDVPNAEVNLTRSFDANKKYSQNTTVSGQTTFTNIPYGIYNLTVEFEDSINNTLVFLNLNGQQTFNLTTNFDYTVRINEYIDNDPPVLSNIAFFSSNKTFHAEVVDASTLLLVNLSLTASNTSFMRNKNYTMVTTDGILYYNETAAKDLAAVNVTYNITAIDIAGNIRISENYSFLLGDITPPIIHEYNVTDYKNGTLQFFANISDSQSDVQDPVILKINDSFVEMHLNASGYWIYRTQAYYDITLNYTLWSVNDSVGNWEEDIEAKFAFTPKFGLATPKDAIAPHIWGVTDTFATHENGYVTFTSSVDDWNEFQSGADINSVKLNLTINGVESSYIMTPIGATTYYYEFTFNVEDTVYYRINASDLAGNINPGDEHGPFIIDDNAIPVVSYTAEEWGNGTVDFYAEVVDWPNNETTAVVSFTQNWFDTPWPNITMTEISESQFHTRFYDDRFQLEDIWYYVTANDSSDNFYEPTLDQSKNITITDRIPPTIFYTIEESTYIDGKITITAYATDAFVFSNFVNDTFRINMTSSSTSIETTMEYDPIYRNWFKTHSFPYEEEVDISIGVQDEAGNFGKVNKTIIIDDLAPPNIIDYDATVYQNGTVIIWAEVVEGEYGSGLPETNSSVFVEYIDIFSRILVNETMIWNGSGNIFAYTIQGFEPGQSFTYKISAFDKKANPNETEWEPVSIYDLTPPVCDRYNYQKTAENHYSIQFEFWAHIYDDFGSISEVNLTIQFYNSSHSWNNQSKMHYNGSYYILSIPMIRDCSFNYSILISDGTFAIEVRNSSLRTLTFQPTELLDSGSIFPQNNIGEVLFWCEIYDPFDDHEVLLSVFDDINQSWILKDTPMISNETNHYYSVAIPYTHSYSYTIRVIDVGSRNGYYEPSEGSGSGFMDDHWRPVIHSSGVDEINGSIIVWANVTDWGTGVTEVLLFINFESESNGGASIQYEEIPMEINGSDLYIAELTIKESGTFYWFIEASDEEGSSRTDENNFPVFSPIPPGIPLEIVILIIFVIILILSVLLYGTNTIRKTRSMKFKKLKQIETKLSIISNVFTILVSTEVGVPIYTLTNVMYQKDGLLDDALSGLSVGIDTFLQSFQSDFLQQVQQQDSEISETRDGISIRMSVIEQHEVQVLIAATSTFRVFVFLREQPSRFTRDAFYLAIEDLEKNVHIRDLGIVDEREYGPLVELILQKYFPLTLLEPFVIDTVKLQRLDEGLKRGRTDIPISSSAISSLKRLVVTHTLSKGKESNFDKFFNEAVKNGSLLESRMLLYNDAKEIMTKLLKIPPQQIYEALWIGSAPDVRVIIPQRV